MDIQSIGGGELAAAPSQSVKINKPEVKAPKVNVKQRTDSVDVNYARSSEKMEVEIEDAEVRDSSIDHVDKQKIIERKMARNGSSRYNSNMKKQNDHEPNTAIYDRVVQAYEKQKGMIL